MEKQQLICLEAVARHSSLGRAAKALGVAQSTVSRRIAALERTVGLPLFIRKEGFFLFFCQRLFISILRHFRVRRIHAAPEIAKAVRRDISAARQDHIFFAAPFIPDVRFRKSAAPVKAVLIPICCKEGLRRRDVSTFAFGILRSTSVDCSDLIAVS